MLQQTRVEAVVEPYKRFMRRFPSIAAIARAHEDDVLAEWSGLGYYRRARMLHAGARCVAAEHSGRIPRSREALEGIPGIGSYTASAILAIAFGEREAALDANVLRVVARIGGVTDPRSADGRKNVVDLAARLVDCDSPGEINEALMDLGSAVCTAKIARCELCPLARICSARASGDPLAFAPLRARKAPREIELACAMVVVGGRVLLLRRSRGDALLAGLWELPTIERGEAACSNGEASSDVETALADLVRARAALDVSIAGRSFEIRHDIVGRKIRASVYEARVRGTLPRRLPEGARLLDHTGRSRVGMPALPAKAIEAFFGGTARRARFDGFEGSGGAADPEGRVVAPSIAARAAAAALRARADRAPTRSRAARGAA